VKIRWRIRGISGLKVSIYLYYLCTYKLMHQLSIFMCIL
jgi:hypothetical protein